MPTRFVILAGPDEAIDALVATMGGLGLSADLPLRHRSPKLALFANLSADILPFAGDEGFVVGRLFDRSTGRRVDRLSGRDAEEVPQSGGLSLLSTHWGAYVAIAADQGGHWALRDPSGALPIYHTAVRGVQVYASDAAALLASGLIDPQADLAFAAHWLAYPYLRTARTGLAGIFELLPGMRRRVSRGRETAEMAWSPWRFASPASAISDFGSASSGLAEVLLQAVPSCGAGKERILLELSGGLDSSVVAAALREAGMPFTAITFVTSSPDGDERRYAGQVAAAMGASIVEIWETEEPVDLSVPEPALRPGLSPLVMPLHRAFEAHAAAVGADAFLTGAGGDSVFCYITTAAPIVDAFLDCGLGVALGATARDVAAMNGCTWWKAVRLAAAKLLRGRRRPPWKLHPEFLAEGAIPRLDAHPWWPAPAGTRPGQREHVVSLLRIQHFLDPEIRLSDIDSIHPLMSQPVVEVCLRVPSWLWVRGGRNRAVARKALRDRLPREILSRSTKGRLESMCARTYAGGRKAVAELLLDGRLAAAGLLDLPRLEAYLRSSAAPSGTAYFRVMELAATELWLRSWDDGPRLAASARQRANWAVRAGSGST
jgi:asparagine synthase (glutamine-hydrolysing)